MNLKWAREAKEKPFEEMFEWKERNIKIEKYPNYVMSTLNENLSFNIKLLLNVLFVLFCSISEMFKFAK